MADNTIDIRYSLKRGSFELQVVAELPLKGVTGVFGESGAGKTTLLRCMAGLETVNDGRLLIAGDTWEGGGNSRPAHRRPIGYVFQEPRLFDHLSVRENIEFSRRRRPAAQKQDVGEVTALLGLDHLLDRKPGDLSGGEAQRVAIARALVSAPQVVLMDEPLASLDQARRDEILPYLDRLHREAKVPILYVSHNIDEICRLCDWLLVLSQGRVVADGTIQDVLLRSDLPVLAGEEACSVIEGMVESFDESDGLLRLGIASGELWVPGGNYFPGSPVRLRIRANDVSLSRERPRATTILNVIPVTIESIGESKSPSVLLRLSAGTDRLLARVTQRSVRELALSQGDKVYAQIKSVAVRRS